MNIPIPTHTLKAFDAGQKSLAKSMHPGLLLDKFVYSFSPEASDKWQQSVQLPTIDRVCAQRHFGQDFDSLRTRRMALLAGPTSFRAQTTGPLTMHLSRAGALENAGICLHPLYGFAYLPGTGLKGLARAYAQTIAKPAGLATDSDIRAVFGHAPTRTDKTESAGSIIFHDAWPTTVPKLVADIVNNHHGDYYTNKDGKNPPPGDWEDPVPVYFLAVAPKTTFHFALAKRRDDTDERLLELARIFLLGGLIHLGAGAKTNAGYGSFVEVIDDKPAQRPKFSETAPRATFECTLELVSPAFLAGAKQDKDDCDLRPATLRGQLRWWWRTMHAGYLSVEQLRTLEAAIWGDTKRGGAVRIALETIRKTQIKSIKDRRSGSPSDPIKYITYGMDDAPGKPPRQYLEPSATWQLLLSTRQTTFTAPDDTQAKPITISAKDVLAQATAALWLLCTYGGVGAKARKGFGSLVIVNPSRPIAPKDVPCLISSMRPFRQSLSLPNQLRPERDKPYPSLDDAVNLSPVDGAQRSGTDVWAVIKDTGVRLKNYVMTLPKDGSRAALGVPRKNSEIRGLARHSAPYHIHLNKTANDYTLSAIAFIAHRLPSAEVSLSVLDGFLNALNASGVSMTESKPVATKQAAVPLAKPLPKSKPVAAKPIGKGQTREGTLFNEGGKWYAILEGGVKAGITNQDKVPPDAVPKSAEFYIAEASKAGVRARFEKFI